MAFDVFFQAFNQGNAGRVSHDDLAASMAPIVDDVDGGYAHLRTADGGADIYGYDDMAHGFMANHIEGKLVWDVLVDLASMAGLAVMPIGCPVCVTTASDLDDLPPELRPSAVVVRTGGDLLRTIREA